MKKTQFGNGKLINWRTVFKKREKDSEGKNQQDAQGQQQHSSIAINLIDREPSSTSAGRENISPEIISALNSASAGTTRIIPTNAPCETLAAVAPSPAFPELIVSPPDTATIKEGKDTTLSEPSRADGQEVKVEGSGHWRLWDQAYGELINDKKSAGLMEGYKTLLNGNLKPEDKDYRDPARHDLMASLIKEKLEIMSKRQWTLPWGKTSFVVREQAEKIVKVIQKFSGIGTVAASLNPTHAGVAWAGVCFLLPVSSLEFCHQFPKFGNSVTRALIM